MSSVNIAARYGATPTPVATSNAGAQAGVEGEASASILRKAIDSASAEATQLIAAIPNVSTSDAPLPPIGNVGRHFDSRM